MDPKENIIGEYIAISKEYRAKYGPKAILLLQVGSFMEIYVLAGCDDPELSNRVIIESAVQLCGLNMAEKKMVYESKSVHPVSSNVGRKYPVVMAGFRDYVIEKYLKILTDGGYTAVVFYQHPDPNSKSRTPAFIRKLDSVHSPGTHVGFDVDTITSLRSNTNNLMCIWLETYTPTRPPCVPAFICGIANIDCITGASAVYEYQTQYPCNGPSPSTCDELERMVSIYKPTEVIIISRFTKEVTNTIIQYSGITTQNIHRKSLSATDDKTLENIQQEKYIRQLLTVF